MARQHTIVEPLCIVFSTQAVPRALQGLPGAPRVQLLAAHVALPAICSALTAATETHAKYHAVGALAACLEQMKALLQASCLLGSHEGTAAGMSQCVA